MAVIGTFGQFGTARLAIYASQASLTVTGNNIANINTDGYTRQRMDLVSLYSTGQGKYANIFNTNVGYGVLTNGVTRLRDPYLDIRYRNENTKLNASDEKRDGLYQISNILDEVGKGTENTDTEGFGVIEAQFGKFIDALNAGVGVNQGSEEYDKLVRSAAETLTAYFRKAASDLEDIKVNKANELVESVAEINNLLTNIRDLNSQIRTQGIYGEQAPELRDARDLALDKLSGYIPIDVTYSMERIDQFTEVEKLTVTIKNSQGPDKEPIKLVDGIYGGQITIPDRMPELNPDSDPKAIIDAMNEARKLAMALTDKEVKDRAGQDWDVELPEAIQKATESEIQKVLEQYGMKENTPDEIDRIAQKPIQRVLNKYKMADASDAEIVKAAKGNADKEKEIRDALAKANDESTSKKAEIQAALTDATTKGTEKGTNKILNKWRQQFAEEDAADAEEKTTKTSGKYVLSKDANGNVIEATDDWEAATTPPAGYFNFDEKNMIDPDSLYLMRVEELVDQRGRIMDDKNEPSGKSQVVALDDVTFCAKAADRLNDATRVDSNALGSLQAIREMLTREGEYSTTEDIERDSYAGIKRGIRYYEKALDNLAQKFADEFNKMNQISLDKVYGFDSTDANAGPVDKDGNPLMYKGNPIKWSDITETMQAVNGKGELEDVLDEDKNKVLAFKTKIDDKTPLDDDTKAMIEIVREQAKKAPGYSFYDGGVLISNRGDNNDPSGITAANISVSSAWSNHTVHLLAYREKFQVDGAGNETPHSTIRDNIDHMITEFDKKRDFYAKDVTDGTAKTDLPVFHGSFREVFTAISGVLADDYSETISKTENYTVSALSLENDRQSVSGVDLNDEATNMMQFSKSYAAACRLLTTIDSMLDTLINGTAR